MLREPKKPITDIFNVGRVAPQDVDVERSVLGVIMLEKTALMNVAPLLKPEIFYSETNQKIYRAISTLYDAGKPVDIKTVIHALKATNDLEMCGGAYNVSSLTDHVASGANVEYYAQILIEQWMKREIIRISHELTVSAYNEDTDIFDLLGSAQQQVSKVQEGFIEGSMSNKDLVKLSLTEYNIMQSSSSPSS